ncbi:MAG: acyl-CoA thioesterase [Xanthobacteraceae bacterium]|nr:MAG: acyl-CoA thioesterase [Xanthobacteraceae bacterium]
MIVAKRVIKVEWGDCDPAGIVYNPRYFDWFDSSTANLFAVLGVPKRQMLTEYASAGIPLVETRATFMRPSKWGDEIVINTRFIEIRKSSFKVAHRLYNNNELAVEGFETRVWVELDPFQGKLRSRPIPDDIVKKMQLE